MASIGVIVHLEREAASEHARELAEWLTSEGHATVLLSLPRLQLLVRGSCSLA